MSDQFPFEIINGYRRVAERGEPIMPSGKGGADNHILEHLIRERPERNLFCILETCQKRLDALLEDRNRLGRHLHDHVLRPLFAITANFPSHDQLSASTISPPSGFNTSLTRLKTVIQELRRVIRELEVGAVQEFDLVSELCELIKSYEPLGHLIINLSIHPQVPNLLTLEERRELFNISREAINNCVRHAQATRAIIKLNHSNARIRLAIMDNGIGFCPAETCSRGYGLPNIETRVRKLGGQLRVFSEKGRGTEIVADFALEPILKPA